MIATVAGVRGLAMAVSVTVAEAPAASVPRQIFAGFSDSAGWQAS
jgi:hypothetical protein